uniref:Secretin receptor n=1 Tax=Canis lupus familiaris TaxID=9615 RepID=A0A8C0QF49_CANLF
MRSASRSSRSTSLQPEGGDQPMRDAEGGARCPPRQSQGARPRDSGGGGLPLPGPPPPHPHPHPRPGPPSACSAAASRGRLEERGRPRLIHGLGGVAGGHLREEEQSRGRGGRAAPQGSSARGGRPGRGPLRRALSPRAAGRTRAAVEAPPGARRAPCVPACCCCSPAPRTPWVPSPDCVMCCRCCGKNGTSASRNSPKRNQETWAWSNQPQHEYLMKLKVMYTVGYSSSLVMLLVALSILCAFRRLHCTRNYIHMHLFVSFILRALSNFIKDAVLFSSDDVAHCDAHRVGCKLVMAFFQYCIMANYAWLLVEGLYLHTLLVISFFSERKCLQGFVALGWGSPAIFVASWAISRHFLEDVGCWDVNANESIWWVIRGPVILSILINFILFINILRILMRKLRTQETRGKEMNHYKRLAKSTLLLIPLFGVHYIIFAFSPEDAMEVQLFFELALGSFQGLVVAVLYCFLNGEVQLEVQKKWQQWHLRELLLRPVALSTSFSNGTSGLTGFTHSTKASTSEQSRAAYRASVI